MSSSATKKRPRSSDDTSQTGRGRALTAASTTSRLYTLEATPEDDEPLFQAYHDMMRDKPTSDSDLEAKQKAIQRLHPIRARTEPCFVTALADASDFLESTKILWDGAWLQHMFGTVFGKGNNYKHKIPDYLLLLLITKENIAQASLAQTKALYSEARVRQHLVRALETLQQADPNPHSTLESLRKSPGKAVASGPDLLARYHMILFLTRVGLALKLLGSEAWPTYYTPDTSLYRKCREYMDHLASRLTNGASSSNNKESTIRDNASPRDVASAMPLTWPHYVGYRMDDTLTRTPQVMVSPSFRRIKHSSPQRSAVAPALQLSTPLVQVSETSRFSSLGHGKNNDDGKNSRSMTNEHVLGNVERRVVSSEPRKSSESVEPKSTDTSERTRDTNPQHDNDDDDFDADEVLEVFDTFVEGMQRMHDQMIRFRPLLQRAVGGSKKKRTILRRFSKFVDTNRDLFTGDSSTSGLSSDEESLGQADANGGGGDKESPESMGNE